MYSLPQSYNQTSKCKRCICPNAYKDLSTNLAGQVIIGFPDFNNLLHEDVVKTSKLGFQDANYTKTVKAINFLNPIDAL